MTGITSRWNEDLIRDRAPYLRGGKNRGVRRALAEAKRLEAGLRDEDTPPGRRKADRIGPAGQRAAGGKGAR